MYVISQVYVIYVAVMLLFPLQMFMYYCLYYPEEGLIVLSRKRSICFAFNKKKMLNPTKLLLIALIWFCKSTSLPKSITF